MQILVKPAAIGDLGQAVDTRFLTFLRGLVALINEDLNHDFQVSFLPPHCLNQLLQFLLGRLPLSNLSRQASAEPV